MDEIPEVKVRRVHTGLFEPGTTNPMTIPHLGDVVRYLLRNSPLVGAKNVNQLADILGLRQSTVRDWYKKETAPNLETLTAICLRLGTDVVHFFLQYPEFSDTARSPHRAVADAIASMVSRPDSAVRLLAILREQQKLGLIDAFLDFKASELGVNPTYAIRSIDRPAQPRKK